MPNSTFMNFKNDIAKSFGCKIFALFSYFSSTKYDNYINNVNKDHFGIDQFNFKSDLSFEKSKCKLYTYQYLLAMRMIANLLPPEIATISRGEAEGFPNSCC